MPVQIKFRRGTAAEWTTVDPILAAGEPGVELDTGKFKIGDGTSTWTELGYSFGDVSSEILTAIATGAANAVNAHEGEADPHPQYLEQSEGDARYVRGPASSTDSNLALFDGITGKLIKDAGAALSSLLAKAGGVMSGNIDMGGHKVVGYTAHVSTVSGAQTVDQSFCGVYYATGAGGVWVLPGSGFTKPVTFSIHHDGTGNITFATNAGGTIKYGANSSHTKVKTNGAVTVTLLNLSSGAYVWNVIGQTEV